MRPAPLPGNGQFSGAGRFLRRAQKNGPLARPVANQQALRMAPDPPAKGAIQLRENSPVGSITRRRLVPAETERPDPYSPPRGIAVIVPRSVAITWAVITPIPVVIVRVRGSIVAVPVVRSRVVPALPVRGVVPVIPVPLVGPVTPPVFLR